MTTVHSTARRAEAAEGNMTGIEPTGDRAAGAEGEQERS
jgi:hypothetical protein